MSAKGIHMIDAVRNRRSIRRYQDRAIDAGLIKQLQDAMLRVPSSRNLKPWRFVFVTDKPSLQALAHAKASFGEFIGSAPLAVAICGDASVSDCWIEDCAIAAATLQLAATDLGLGSCWVQIRARQHADGTPAEAHVLKALNLPEGLRVLCIVTVGPPCRDQGAQGRRIALVGQSRGSLTRADLRVPQEPEVEGHKHQDDADIRYQPFPESIPEEQQIHANDNGYQDQDEQHHISSPWDLNHSFRCVSSHPLSEPHTQVAGGR